ncbi:MAG: hypothetical protein APG12_00776 [Candidatus Methanofastidiosum methylothiophilum]|uniref:DUF4349 domain-containing protein n=1 Tax=Candidatus Methanofastidiosum methylothiophilum TaxID=1705564 RepID=A0A150IL93_9EURY|nr:MAG: hypothetical protein APG10_00504 [Candidatus Methanofastidiosum methylthiophilus]KYC48053.1 MAG: hypothetical protein APG11_00623 [Candidatus Methanofastidiosum methylthiophilus]KYC50444.1 MAG: hypothetical protein APG12_00776 [Candidatus Methanofastidiosum methylthiophilus]
MRKSYIILSVIGIIGILIAGFFVGSIFLGSNLYSKRVTYEEGIALPGGYGGSPRSDVYSKTVTQSYTESRNLNSIDRKVVKNGNANIEVENFDYSIAKIKELTSNFGGFVTNSNMWISGSDTKSGNITVKIPENKFEEFGDSLNQIGMIKSKDTSAYDVTEEYVDLQARLKNLRNQEKRYNELLIMAKDVQDVLAIEVQLGRIRGEIESYEGRIKYLDNTTSFGTFYINIYEPQKVVHKWGIKNAFDRAIDAFILSIAGIIILGGFFIPILILIGVVYLIVKYVKKRVKK